MRSLLSLTLIIVLALFIAAPSTAVADDAIIVKLRLIYGNNDGARIDTALKDIEKTLKNSFPTYTSFEHLKTERWTLKLDATRATTLPDRGATTLELTHLGWAKDRKVRLGIELKDKLKTEVLAAPRATFFQAGLFYKDGILILAISANADR